MTLVIACVASWLVIVVCLVAMFRIAARGDEALLPPGWRAGLPDDEPQPDELLPPAPLRRFNRRLHVVP